MIGRMNSRHAVPFGWVDNVAEADGRTVGEVKQFFDRWHWYVYGLGARRSAGIRRTFDDARKMVEKAYDDFLHRETNNRDTSVPTAQLAQFRRIEDDAARLSAVDVLMHEIAETHGIAVRRVSALGSWRFGSRHCLDLRWATARGMSLIDILKTGEEMVVEIARMERLLQTPVTDPRP